MSNEKGKLSLFKNEWIKVLLISVVSIVISIIGINVNIEREKSKLFDSMKLKIRTEVERDLYKELSEKFKLSVEDDLRNEYREFVKFELRKSLRDDTFKSLKHQIDSEGIELFYDLIEFIEYKQNGEDIRHCEVVVNNLDKVFDEELEGLFKQIFGNCENKKGVLLVFSKEPEERGYRPDFRLENGLNDQILIMRDGNLDVAHNSLIIN